MKKVIRGLVASAAFAVGIMLGTGVFGIKTYAAESKTPKGISISGMDVSGMTEEQVASVLDQYLNSVGETPVKIGTSEKSMDIKAADLGIKKVDDTAAKRAVNYLKNGNPLEIVSRKAYLDAGNKKDIKLALTCDAAKLGEFLTAHAADLSNPAVDATLKRENGQFTIVDGVIGNEINVEASTVKISNYIEKEWDRSSGDITLETEQVQPKGSKEELSKVKDLLGSATTDYSSSIANRKHNVALGASFINGQVIYPGEILSVFETIAPISVEHGYKIAPGYSNGQVVDAEGGGICQVATTTYDAAMRAELGIETRSCHSMTVHYVDVAFDAAISGSKDGKAIKDLQLRNDFDFPVYIEEIADGSHLTVNVYGMETRPADRVVTFQNEILSTTPIENSFVEDPTLPVGTVVRESSGSVGYKARLWKIVTVNGVEESRKEYNKSNYIMSKAIYRVGTATGDPAQQAAMKAAIDGGDQNTILGTAAGMGGEISSKLKDVVPEPIAPPAPEGTEGQPDPNVTVEGGEVQDP